MGLAVLAGREGTRESTKVRESTREGTKGREKAREATQVATAAVKAAVKATVKAAAKAAAKAAQVGIGGGRVRDIPGIGGKMRGRTEKEMAGRAKVTQGTEVKMRAVTVKEVGAIQGRRVMTKTVRKASARVRHAPLLRHRGTPMKSTEMVEHLHLS